MGPDGVNYTIGNVKAAFGSVSRSLSVSLCLSLSLSLSLSLCLSLSLSPLKFKIFSLQFAHGGAVNWAASIGVRWDLRPP